MPGVHLVNRVLVSHVGFKETASFFQKGCTILYSASDVWVIYFLLVPDSISFFFYFIHSDTYVLMPNHGLISLAHL